MSGDPEHTSISCEMLLSNDMEVRRLIRKPLQPARPIRRSLPGNGSVLMVNFQAKSTDHCRDSIREHYNLWCSIGKLHDVFKDPVTEKPPVNNKKERITYSRDFLMQLSTLSVSKQKPDYLPDLPIILPHPISVRSSYYGMYQKTSPIHGGCTSQLPEHKGSAADISVPDTTGHLQRPCGVHALMRQSC